MSWPLTRCAEPVKACRHGSTHLAGSRCGAGRLTPPLSVEKPLPGKRSFRACLRYERRPDESVARLLSGSAAEPFGRLAGDLRDEVEVLVLMQDDEASALGDGCNEQIWHRRRPVIAAVGEQTEDLDGAILGGGRCILDRHRRDRWLAQPCAKVLGVAC